MRKRGDSEGALEAQGINFSMGLGQVNRTNLARYGLTYETAFDPCENLRGQVRILETVISGRPQQWAPGTGVARSHQLLLQR